MNKKVLISLNLVFGVSILVLLFIVVSDRFSVDSNRQDQSLVNTVDKAQLNTELALLRAEFLESIKLNNGIGADSKFLMSEISELKSKLAQLENSTASNQENQASEPLSEQDIVERRRLRDETILTEFQDQPVDEIWSTETASKVDQVLLDSQLSSLGFSTPECRSTTCKIDIQFSDDPDVNDEAEYFLLTQVSKYLPRAKAVKNSDGTLSYFFSSNNNPTNQSNAQQPPRKN